MKRTTILIFLALTAAIIHAQNYMISFAGTGDRTTVSIVTVENLTSGATVSLLGTDILHLVSTTGMSDHKIENKNLQINPNPMAEQSILTFKAPGNGNTVIVLVDPSGKKVAQIHTFLSSGEHSFRISGIGQGIYLIKVIGNTYNYSAKVISQSNIPNDVKMEHISLGIGASISQLKSSSATIDMNYIAGEQLIFKAVSGVERTILVDVPTSSKTITFNFAACKDFENNQYTTVKIGTQVWMAENLKTTKYNDGTSIPLVTDNATWGNLSTAGYCWYNNDLDAYKNTYGALYNIFAVKTDKLSPAGWHVPSNDEWTTLTTFLGGENVAGGKLKESGLVHWLSPNTSATNESGFSALPGGNRINDGNYYDLGNLGYWWSSTVSNAQFFFYRFIDTNNANASKDKINNTYGLSVRCVKD